MEESLNRSSFDVEEEVENEVNWEEGENFELEQILMRPSLHLGEVDEEEGICCKGRHGCRKRTCCMGVIVIIVLVDIIYLVMVLVFLGENIYNAVKFDSQDSQNTTVLFVRKRILVYASGWIVWFFKIFAGIRWLWSRKRHNFVIYYTYSLTSNFSYSFFLVLYLIFGLAADNIAI